MRLVLHPAGLIRVLQKHTEKRRAPAQSGADRPDVSKLEDYEVTPYGRRLRRMFPAKLKLTATAVALGAAAMVIWLLV